MKKRCFRVWFDLRNLRECATANLRTDRRQGERPGEQGFMLVGLIVAIFIILLVLGVAAPRAAQELKREREVEAVHRGNQYVRAIQLYYRKNNSYPGTMDALAKGTPVKFLRQEYVDPFTGKADWRLIHVGEAKTTVKGFFGQPLTGLAPGLGSAAGQASAGGIGAGAAGSGTPFGGSNAGGFGSSASGSSAYSFSSSGAGGLGGASSAGSSPGSTSGAGTSGTNGASTGSDASAASTNGTAPTNTLGSAAGIASQSSGGFSGGGAPFVGVGIPKEGTTVVVLNEQTSYNTWEFIYDPRIEQLKAAAGLLGGGNQGLGSAGGISSGVGGAGAGAPGGFGSSGTSGFGASGTGFGSSGSSGSSSGSGFGSSSGSGFGSSPTSGSQGTGTTSPTTPQQPQ